MESGGSEAARSVEVVTAIYANVASDASAISAFVAPDALILGFPGGTSARGPEGLVGTLAELRPLFRTLSVEPVDVATGAERILVHLRVGGIGQSGAELWRDTYHVHTVRNHRSVRIEAFEDQAAAERAAGLDGSQPSR